MKLTYKRISVLRMLNEWPHDYHSPSELGLRAGKIYNESSSWATGALKPLFSEGLVERSADGHYRITLAGQEALHA